MSEHEHRTMATSLRFEGLTPEWAIDVATQLDRFAHGRPPPVDDLWVASDLALLARYRLIDYSLAVRFARLDVDPTSSLEPVTSGQLASNLYHSFHSPSEWEWTDADGYLWWGDRPDRGWPTVMTGGRLLTVR
ncbi:MAG: hypothetical protein M3235_19545 [Actinomycetota bacterium]|nr:hypothetical protein [Actinomycetota bacterium]